MFTVRTFQGGRRSLKMPGSLCIFFAIQSQASINMGYRCHCCMGSGLRKYMTTFTIAILNALCAGVVNSLWQFLRMH